MAAAQDGDSTTYESLLHAILPMMRSYVRARMRRPDAAEDVVQNVLFALHRSRHTYHRSRPFKPWLRAVMRNAIIDSLRASSRHEGRHQAFEEEHFAADVEPVDDFGGELSPELSRALEQLPAAQREAVELLHIHELSVVAAAAKVGISPGAFKVRAHRGRAALRELLKEDGT